MKVLITAAILIPISILTSDSGQLSTGTNLVVGPETKLPPPPPPPTQNYRTTFTINPTTTPAAGQWYWTLKPKQPNNNWALKENRTANTITVELPAGDYTLTHTINNDGIGEQTEINFKLP